MMNITAHLMHFLPFTSSTNNPDGGMDIVQASSIRRLPVSGNLHQTCGVQVAVESPRNATAIWRQLELRQGNTVTHRDVVQLILGVSSVLRCSNLDVWSWLEVLNFDAPTGLHEIRLSLSPSRQSFPDCHGVSAIYLAPAQGQAQPPQIAAGRGVQVILMHLAPFNGCTQNPRGGFDLVQATSIRSVSSSDGFTQSCGVQAAILAPLNAASLWRELNLFDGKQMVHRDVKELKSDAVGLYRAPGVEVWSWDESLPFSSKPGLYRIRVALSTRNGDYQPLRGESAVVVAEKEPQEKASVSLGVVGKLAENLRQEEKPPQSQSTADVQARRAKQRRFIETASADTDTIDSLVDVWRDADEVIRSEVVKRLASLDKDRYTRYAATKALCSIDDYGRERETIVRLLLSRLDDEHWHTAAFAALALGAVRPVNPQIVKGLTRALSNRYYDVRGPAASALAEIGPAAASASDRLEVVAQTDTDFHVRKEASDALAKILGREPEPDLNMSIFDETTDAISKQLPKLPRWARVALAVRTVRRVQSVYEQSDKIARHPGISPLADALGLAEQCAASARCADPEVARSAARAVMRTCMDYGDARNVALAGADAAKAAVGDDRDLSGTKAAYHAIESAYLSGADAAAILEDLRVVQAAAKREHWTDDTPVDLSIFGNR